MGTDASPSDEFDIIDSKSSKSIRFQQENSGKISGQFSHQENNDN